VTQGNKDKKVQTQPWVTVVPWTRDKREQTLR